MPDKRNRKMIVETQNASLHRAKGAKEDEFYTQREDVEQELKHYRKHFKGKVVYCNCDD
ncbi:adenine-specific methyltransferase EcoRI family protein, partial [Sulfitobacter sp. CW3]|uniref:adenine-specific methyltransferase EcoRI family protein n=1 Tax=Sulfitobacter sp. CW3 TaxID=2861965 RepID=UPI0034D64120